MSYERYKVSGTGWLCYEEPNGKWVPIFKLTPEQLREWKKFHKVSKS